MECPGNAQAQDISDHRGWRNYLASQLTPRDIFLVVLAQRLVEKADPQIKVNFLHQLKITLPDCNEQVCKRWSEFQPSLIP